VSPIETASYSVVAERLDLSAWAPGPRAVVARVVHATAQPELAADLVVDEAAVAAGVAALSGGAPVVCDVEMVRAGLRVRATCLLPLTAAAGEHETRTAAAMAAALDRAGPGALVVVGCAPTALAEVNRRLGRGFQPALVVGVPVGYIGAAAAKEELLAAAGAAGVPAIVLRGERGGAAVAAAVVNALVGLAGGPGPGPTGPAPMFLMGHGTRSEEGAAQLRRFADAVAAARPGTPVGAGFIEFMTPGLDETIDRLVTSETRHLVTVPLVLLGAGHMKDDGPVALRRARARHRGVGLHYARDLGVHPLVLSTVADRIAAAAAALPGGAADAVVVVGRGSSDPDANAELVKAARLLADGRALARPFDAGPADGTRSPVPLALVEPAFVSLAAPGVPGALERCHRLGARRIAVVPYFLFTGLLVDRIAAQAAAWAQDHPGTAVVMGEEMGVDPRLVELTWARYDEAVAGPVHMNCDGCLHRVPLPGYEARLGAPPATDARGAAERAGSTGRPGG